MEKTDPNYCPDCGIHRYHASPGCEKHGQENPLAGKSADQDGSYDAASVDASRSDDELLKQFTDEATAGGYTQHAAETIALDRLANLRAGGDGYCRDLLFSEQPQGVPGALVPAKDGEPNVSGTAAE